MRYTPLPLEGAFLIDMDKLQDERGFFARVYCAKEFQERGLESNFVQVNNSLSVQKGTLRGLHYQIPPYQETKLVRCIKGSCYDLIVDLRKESKTYGDAFGAVLSMDNHRMMYVPKGFAHGFLTLEENTELVYMVSEYYHPKHERGIRYDDKALNINWPEKVTVVSERDLKHPNFDLATGGM